MKNAATQQIGYYATVNCSQSLGSARSWQGTVYGDQGGQCAKTSPCGVNNELCPNTGSGSIFLQYFTAQPACPAGQVLQVSALVVQAANAGTYFRFFGGAELPVAAQINDSVTCVSFGSGNAITGTQQSPRPAFTAVCDSYDGDCQFRFGGTLSCVDATVTVLSTPPLCAYTQCGFGECTDGAANCNCSPERGLKDASEPGQLQSHCYPIPSAASSTGDSNPLSSTSADEGLTSGAPIHSATFGLAATLLVVFGTV